MWKRNFESETKNLKTTKIKNLVDGFDIELDASEERIDELSEIQVRSCLSKAKKYQKQMMMRNITGVIV